MPRESEIQPKLLLSQLKKRRLFDQRGHLKGESNVIWQEIKTSLKLRMAAKSLHLYVYNNRHGCRDELEAFFNIKKKGKRKRLEKDLDFEPEESENPWDCSELNFVITVSAGTVIDKTTRTKKKSWADKIRSEIWNEHSLPCPFSLNGYVTQDQFKFSGKCSDCGTSIVGFSENYTNSDLLILHIKTFATHEIKHTKKTKLAGETRDNVQNILLTKLACDYREEQLEKLTKNYEPPFLNDTQTYRKAREEALNKDIGYDQFKKVSITN